MPSSYSVEFKESAVKEFNHLPKKVRTQVAEVIQLLAINPFSHLLNIKKLKGAAALFRARVGNYRIIYEIQKTRLVIVIIKIGDRKEVYRHL